MDAEDIQCVVIAQLPFDIGDGNIAEQTHQHADENRIHRIDETAGRGDGNQPGHGAR